MDSTQKRYLLDNLQAYAESIIEFIEDCQGNEEQTKMSLINPYLRVLGIEVNNSKVVKFETNTALKGKSNRADYIVHQNGKPILIIEAKAAGTELDERHFGQLNSYAYTEKSVRISALTNGITWHWYMKSGDHDVLDEIPFLVSKTSDPKPSEVDWLSALSPTEAERWIQISNDYVIDREFEKWTTKQISDPDVWPIKRLCKELLQTSKQSHLDRMSQNWVSFVKGVVKNGLVPSVPEYKPQNESSIEVEADSDSSTQDSETTKLMTRGGEEELGKGNKRAWRSKNDEFWTVESSMTNVCKALLLQLGGLHDDGLHDFLIRIGESDLKIIRNKSEVTRDPNRKSYYSDLTANWCYFKNEGNPAKIQRLRESSVYCISGKKSIDFDSHFEIWEPS